MQSTHTLVVPARLHSLAALSLLLEKLDRQPRQASPAQYRALVTQLSGLLESTPLDDALDEVLNAFPAAAELYENLQYGHAGLCRHALDASLGAEQATAALLSALRHKA